MIAPAKRTARRAPITVKIIPSTKPTVPSVVEAPAAADFFFERTPSTIPITANPIQLATILKIPNSWPGFSPCTAGVAATGAAAGVVSCTGSLTGCSPKLAG